MNTKLLVAAAAAVLTLTLLPAAAQPQRGAARLRNQAPPAPAVEQALTLALMGPDGEYAVYAEYAAIIQKYGEVQPYASIIKSEECHIAALKRHFVMRSLAVPENPYIGKFEAPATLKAAAEAGVAAEQQNVALYDELLQQVKDQPDLVQVFTHLQWASREHHLPAYEAAVAKDGQLASGEFGCGAGACRGQGASRGPGWAGGAGTGAGAGPGFCGGAGQGWAGGQGGGKPGAGFGNGRGFGRGCQAQSQ